MRRLKRKLGWIFLWLIGIFIDSFSILFYQAAPKLLGMFGISMFYQNRCAESE